MSSMKSTNHSFFKFRGNLMLTVKITSSNYMFECE
jgi:hypothetical protein